MRKLIAPPQRARPQPPRSVPRGCSCRSQRRVGCAARRARVPRRRVSARSRARGRRAAERRDREDERAPDLPDGKDERANSLGLLLVAPYRAAPSLDRESARTAHAAAAAASPAHYEAHHNRGVAAGRLAAAARGALRDAASGRGTPCAARVADDAWRFEAEAGMAYEAVLALALAHARVRVGRA